MSAETAHTAETTPAEIARLADAAASAFAAHRHGAEFSAPLLDAVADAIEEHRDELRELAHEETHLAAARLDGEISRTTAQLRAFAAVVRTGSEIDAIIDRADPSATPPRPDQRRMEVPLGPVAVFAASNFPFAFSVAGGDTASAWAAGCPVLLKAHPAHPRTSRATADAIAEAQRAVGAPDAWFALVEGASPATGQAVVAAPAIRAVAFTGSLAGGTAIAAAAAQRPDPIPAFCEMGSTNPFVVTPAAAAARAPQIAEGLAASISGSAGQLCTKPNVVFVVDDAAGHTLVDELTKRLAEVPPAELLYPGLQRGFTNAVAETARDPRVRTRLDAEPTGDGPGQAPILLEVPANGLAPEDPVVREMFGPASLVVWAHDAAELRETVARVVPGTLSGTLHSEPGEPEAPALLDALAAQAGRVVHNGYPTGVTVGYATVHGGPFPATSAPSTTSVGMTAMRRFLRPVAYQNVPDALLPPALQDANPLGIVRRVDGTLTADAITR